MYTIICRHDGIRAKDIAREIGSGLARADINHLLYGAPLIRELCWRDKNFLWHGLIRQTRPHTGLGKFCGFCSSVQRFRSLSCEEWLGELMEGCLNIGRNLNDTRGLLHSFVDTHDVMMGLFEDLDRLAVHTSVSAGSAPAATDSVQIHPFSAGWRNQSPAETPAPAGWQTRFPAETQTQTSPGRCLTPDDWEICFELRIKKSRHIRIYADVLVITEDKVFSLEFKMKDRMDPEEEKQAAKYAGYLEVIFGPDYDVIPSLVLTRAQDLYRWEPLPDSDGELPVCSGDMLFNLFDEFLGFLA